MTRVSGYVPVETGGVVSYPTALFSYPLDPQVYISRDLQTDMFYCQQRTLFKKESEFFNLQLRDTLMRKKERGL